MATREEALFCKIAIRNKLLTPEQCRECETIRKESGGERGLVDVILEKGYLSAKMVTAILKAEAEAQAGVSQEGTRPATTSEVTDTQFSLELLEPGEQPAIPEQGATVHGELVGDDEPSSSVPSKPQPGDESYERIRREIANLPLVSDSAKTGDNIVYNINIENFKAGDQQQGLVPRTRSDMTLHRDDIGDERLLAIIKGEQVSLPAKAGMEQAPAIATTTAQQSILSALRHNLVLTLIGLGMIAAMFFGILALIDKPDKGTDPNGVKNMDDLIAVLEGGTSSHMRIGAARQIGDRVVKDRDTSGIDCLVRAMSDPDDEVAEAARYQLTRFNKEGLRESAFSSIHGAFERYDGKFKIRCLGLAVSLGVPEESILNLLKKGVVDKDVSVRLKSLDVLSAQGLKESDKTIALLKKGIEDKEAPVRLKSLEILAGYGSEAAVAAMEPLAKDLDVTVRRQLLQVLSGYDSDYSVRAVVPLVHDADAGIATEAAALLWKKRDRVPGDPLLEILAHPGSSPTALTCILKHVASLKVEEYTAHYIRLVNHADAGVKLEALNALAALGPEADHVLAGDGAEKLRQARGAAAAKEGIPLRQAMVKMLGAIHGTNAGNLLFEFYKDDPEAAIRDEAKRLILNKCPDLVKIALAAHDAAIKEEHVKQKFALVEAALKKIEEDKLEEAIVELDRVKADPSDLMNQALARSGLKDRAGLDAKYLEVRKNAGYMQYNNTWVKLDELWATIQAEAQALADQKNFLGAVQKYRNSPGELRQIEGMESEIEKAVENVKALAKNSAKNDIDIIEGFIEAEKFAEADKLLAELEKRFPESEFGYEARRMKETRREYVKAERTWRSRIFHIKSSDREEDVTRKYPHLVFDDKNYLTYTDAISLKVIKFYYRLSENSLQVVLNADKRSGVRNISYGFNLPVGPPRKCDDFSGIEFGLRVPRNASVTITVTCGAITYRKVFDSPGRIQVAFDDFGRSGGVGRERTHINNVHIQFKFEVDPEENKTYSLYIGGIRLLD